MDKKDLLKLAAEMTLEEKALQMTQLSPDMLYHLAPANLTGPLREWRFEDEELWKVGSTLGTLGASYLKKLQKDYLERSGKKIPLLFMSDVIHGYVTIMPIPLAQGCTFDPELTEEAAAAVAKESAASGLHVTFSPMADLVRDPRWGRVMESCGEDPYLNGVMAAATVRGYQGRDPREKGKIASCVKHFAAYGQPEGGREYNTVDMSRGVLRDFYLPAYEAAIRAGAAMVMTSFNTVERTPATCSRFLLRKVLREEWGFDGVVISDFSAVEELMNHSVAADDLEAGEKSIHAGMDIEMMSGVYAGTLRRLLEQGRITQQEIDECVMRILELKNRLGLFENPYKDADEQEEQRLLYCGEHLELARRFARESMVLLKNQSALPIEPSAKIGLAGPFACTGNILGGWHCEGKPERTETLQHALEAVCGDRMVTAMSTHFIRGEKDVPDQVEEAVERLKDCDICIAAVGEPEWETGEASSKTCLRLSASQEKLIHALKAAGKKVVTVIFSGRPLDIAPVLEDSDAVLQAWFPGSAGAGAAADILLGKYNPSGRLSMSFPRNVGQIPVYYNYYNTGRPAAAKADNYVSRYLDCPNSPLFPFGYGLSYTTFACEGLQVEQTAQGGERCACETGRAGDRAVCTASVRVSNRGERSGETVVQLYIRDVSASVVRPMTELKAFRRISLEPGEEAQAVFTVTEDMLSFYNEEEQWAWEPGTFEIMVGLDCEHVEKKEIFVPARTGGLEE